MGFLKTASRFTTFIHSLFLLAIVSAVIIGNPASVAADATGGYSPPATDPATSDDGLLTYEILENMYLLF